MHWKSNLFKVPSGASGKQFVGELMRLFSAFAMESMLEEAIAIKAAMTMRWHCVIDSALTRSRTDHARSNLANKRSEVDGRKQSILIDSHMTKDDTRWTITRIRTLLLYFPP